MGAWEREKKEMSSRKKSALPDDLQTQLGAFFTTSSVTETKHCDKSMFSLIFSPVSFFLTPLLFLFPLETVVLDSTLSHLRTLLPDLEKTDWLFSNDPVRIELP